MPEIPAPPGPTQLIVFADDWGRHPSSSQHLIRELLPQYPTLWVNTIGTRRPTLSLNDLKRGGGLVASWFISRRDKGPKLPEGLRVIAPKMYPGYRTAWQRKLNARRVAQAVEAELLPDHRHVVITTLPTTADLVSKQIADRWVYYCVDDYSQWPGTDHVVMDEMERELVDGVDAIAAVSEVLLRRLQAMRAAPQAELLPHGVDEGFWQLAQSPDADVFGDQIQHYLALDASPLTFWGLIDERLDKAWLSQLSRACAEIAPPGYKVCLIGPVVGDQAAWESLTHDASRAGEVICYGRADHEKLPAIAHFARVLIMPYIDTPVTRAMQPLKLLEYLATMKPVVVRDLPSTRVWADCCDLASDAESFTKLVMQRAETGTPPDQVAARKRRLPAESWAAKAAQLAQIINGG